MKRRFSTIAASAQLAILSLVLLAPAAVSAQAGSQAAQEEVKETVKTGTIANTGTYGQSGAVNVDTDGASPGDEMSVIGASIERLSRSSCEVSVKNSSEKNSYSVSFQVVGMDEAGRRQLFRTYSASVPAKGSVTRTMSCGDYNLQVNLTSAKKQSR